MVVKKTSRDKTVTVTKYQISNTTKYYYGGSQEEEYEIRNTKYEIRNDKKIRREDVFCFGNDKKSLIRDHHRFYENSQFPTVDIGMSSFDG